MGRGVIMSKELLFSVTRKDFRVDTFRSGGKGGQHQNTTDSGVRITHIESGAIGESREQRKQPQNKKIAFIRLVASPKFKLWASRRALEEMGQRKTLKQIEAEVEADMRDSNLLVETY